MKKITIIPVLLLVLLAPATHLHAQLNPDDVAYTEPRNYLAEFADLMHTQMGNEKAPVATLPAEKSPTILRYQKVLTCKPDLILVRPFLFQKKHPYHLPLLPSLQSRGTHRHFAEPAHHSHF